jgi:hypothetical protein
MSGGRPTVVECPSLFGRIFGHKMKQFTVKVTPPSNEAIESMTGFYETFIGQTERMNAARTIEYAIRCSRCGAKADG